MSDLKPGRVALVAIALLVAFAVFAQLTLTSGAAPDRNPKKAIWGPSHELGPKQYKIYKELGISIYSLAIGWDRTAPTRPADPTNPDDPAYRWPKSVVQGVAAAAKAGMRVNLELTKTPPWANGGRELNWAPDNPKDFADFATAAARKFPDVHLWMIWGEPSRRKNFMPYEKADSRAATLTPEQAQGPERYARILDAAWQALHSPSLPGSNRNLVAGGSTFTAGDIRPAQWIRYMRLPNGMPPRLDLYAHNVFSTRRPSFGNRPSSFNAMDFSDVGRLERIVVENLGRPYGKSMIPLFISEWCVPTGPKDDEFNYWVDPPDQAEWIKSAFEMVNSQRFIYALGWIHLIDKQSDRHETRTTCGLLREDGSRKPGFHAFRDS